MDPLPAVIVAVAPLAKVGHVPETFGRLGGMLPLGDGPVDVTVPLLVPLLVEPLVPAVPEVDALPDAWPDPDEEPEVDEDPEFEPPAPDPELMSDTDPLLDVSAPEAFPLFAPALPLADPELARELLPVPAPVPS